MKIELDDKEDRKTLERWINSRIEAAGDKRQDVIKNLEENLAGKEHEIQENLHKIREIDEHLSELEKRSQTEGSQAGKTSPEIETNKNALKFLESKLDNLADIRLKNLEEDMQRVKTEQDEIKRRRAVSGWVFTAAGAGVAIAGVTLVAIAESRARRLVDPKPGTPWSDNLQRDYDSVMPLRIGGWSAVGGGVAAGVAGALIFFLGSDRKQQNDRAGFRLHLANQGARLVWEF